MGKFIIAYHLSTSGYLLQKEQEEAECSFECLPKSHVTHAQIWGYVVLFFFNSLFFSQMLMKQETREVWIPAVTLFGLIPEVSAPYTLLLTGRRRWRNMRTEPQDCLLFMVSDTEVKMYRTCHTVGTTESYWEYPCRVFPSKERGPAASAFLAESFHNILFHL